MSSKSVSQPQVNPNSWAYTFGVSQAKSGAEMGRIFVRENEQCDYEAGYHSVKPAVETAVADEATPETQPRVNRKRNNGREYHRKTDNLPFEAQCKLINARYNRLEAMAKRTVELLGSDYEGEILFAV